ncbi:hypothetical protein, partial [Escherichia coli]|uniref:hypothetical protein n=1 Tax=Escherichia coli TaxID=562 RepID=UPI0039F11F2C
GWAILLRQKQKKLIMLPSETMIWQPEFTDKTLSRKPGAVQSRAFDICQFQPLRDIFRGIFKALQRIHGAWNRARKNAR